MTRQPRPNPSKDVQFLAEEFDIAPFKAAELVAGQSPEADRLADKELRRQHEIDPLADVPTPKQPGDETVDELDQPQLKPVTRQNNMRGAG